MSSPIHAPELDTPLGWLNTDRPLRFDGELRGRVVVLDFWTYCCINCIHILPDLAFLEEKYAADPVTFIGVHSAKFTNEADRETIRAAILRYEIAHPVVIDDRMKLWRAYAVRSWPTVVVIDATGRVAAVEAGEGRREALDRAIAEALSQGRSAGTVADGPVLVRREASAAGTSPLCFPGKVFADAELRRVFVADSNHNRVVVADWPDDRGKCRVVKVVGRGVVGAADGPAEEATFHHPQGLVTGQGKLYVADTENHLIRAIDLDDFSVATVVGTGRMTYDFAGGAMGVDQGINSPWDLTREGSTLYVAMAGEHQIWRIDMPLGFARALAGTGRENLADGPTERAAFAQPSGICLHHGHLFIADSEVSAIRGIDLAVERVYTVIGEGLFTFGDVDGAHPKARLQHPLGVASWGAGLLVADTYNHRIKVVDPAARTARTIFGSGSPGRSDKAGGLMLFEPGGLSCVGDEVFIADTNNHRVIRADLRTKQWTELEFVGLQPPALERATAGTAKPTRAVAAPARLRAGAKATLLLELHLPPNVHLNEGAPWSVEVRCEARRLSATSRRSGRLPLAVVLPALTEQDGGMWTVEASFMCCRDGDAGACFPLDVTWSLAVTVSDDGADRVTLTHAPVADIALSGA